MKNLNIVLLRARKPGDPVREHEHDCFARHAGLEREQLSPHDLTESLPRAKQLKRYDALMVGGAGDYYVSKGDLPRFKAVLELLAELVDLGLPVFASCFGYQCLVQALGGEVIHDPDNSEVGSVELELTPEGRADPLFGALPQRFWAQEGHKDRARIHPKGMPNLASSERSPFQALRVPGKPVWGVQFHPELDRAANQHRFQRYIEGYAQGLPAAERQSVLDGIRESPEACTLPRRFLELVFGSGSA